MLYTVTEPVALLNKEKHPSTFAESKYFFKLLSILALLTEQEEKKIFSSNKEKTSKRRIFLFIRKFAQLLKDEAVFLDFLC